MMQATIFTSIRLDTLQTHPWILLLLGQVVVEEEEEDVSAFFRSVTSPPLTIGLSGNLMSKRWPPHSTPW